MSISQRFNLRLNLGNQYRLVLSNEIEQSLIRKIGISQSELSDLPIHVTMATAHFEKVL